MGDYGYLYKKYPNFISGEQLRLVCHISKRMARYLLQNGLIPYKDGGKPTRKYIVAVNDVITYLKDREINPEKYKPPQGWFYPKEGTAWLSEKDIPDISQEQLMEYYEELFAKYPDVLSLDEAAEITGFVRSSICKWIFDKKFRAFGKSNTYVVPKSELIRYMASPEYRRKPNQKHNYIGGFIEWQGQLS